MKVKMNLVVGYGEDLKEILKVLKKISVETEVDIEIELKNVNSTMIGIKRKKAQKI